MVCCLFSNTFLLKAKSLKIPTNHKTRLSNGCSNTAGATGDFNWRNLKKKKKKKATIRPDDSRQTSPCEKNVECQEQELFRRHWYSFQPTVSAAGGGGRRRSGAEFILCPPQDWPPKGHFDDKKVTT